MRAVWRIATLGLTAVAVIRLPRIVDVIVDGTAPGAGLAALLLPAVGGWMWYNSRRRNGATPHRWYRRLTANRQFVVGAAIVGGLAVAAVLAPVLSSFDPTAPVDLLAGRRLAPSWHHPFGTDDVSRDIWSRTLHGARWSLSVATTAVIILLMVGITVGLLAGLSGPATDTVLMRVVDAGLALPRLLLLLVVAALWTHLSFFALAAILGLTGWFGTSRLVRIEVRRLRRRAFVDAARALDLGAPRMVVYHILPNLVAPITVTAALGIGQLVLLEAGLSYLGLGARAPDPGWGHIIRDGQAYLTTAPWIVVCPGLAIFLTVIGFSLMGDGLRAAVNPRP